MRHDYEGHRDRMVNVCQKCKSRYLEFIVSYINRSVHEFSKALEKDFVEKIFFWRYKEFSNVTKTWFASLRYTASYYKSTYKEHFAFYKKILSRKKKYIEFNSSIT